MGGRHQQPPFKKQTMKRPCNIREDGHGNRFELPLDENACMTFSQIGDALGMSKQATRSVYVRALQKLRKCHPEALQRLLALSAERQRLLPMEYE